MYDLAVRGMHGLESFGRARCQYVVGHLGGEPLKRFLTALTVTADVDPDATVVRAGGLPLDHGAGQLLDRLQRLTLGPDEQTQVVTLNPQLDGVLVEPLLRKGGVEVERIEQPLQ